MAGLGVLIASITSLAQGTLTPILANGPISNRVNMVVLSEGYTSNQFGLFLTDTTNVLNSLFATEPFREYASYFNTYAIAVASAQSGSDHPATGGPFKDTYFSSSYDSLRDEIISIPMDATGQGKLDALITNLLPQADITLLVVNDLKPGGSSGLGGTNGTSNRRPVIVSKNQGWPSDGIVSHELAHFFAGLVDEYTNAYTGYVPVEAPNATKTTSRASIKWAAWIDVATPIPTPATEVYAASVGLFEGAQYQQKGWYRPKLHCRMGQDGLYCDFCEVCREQIVKAIHQAVHSIDQAVPSNSAVTVLSPEPIYFTLSAPQAQTHNLAVQWYTNRTTVIGATNLSLQLSPRQLGDGTHTVSAIVRDTTPWVRNDPTRLLQATNSWALTVSMTELRLTALRYLDEDRFRLTVTGNAPRGFVIQASSDLSDWFNLTTNSLTGATYHFTNSGLTGLPFRFYRTVSPP